jgi:hypothetical protein
MRDFALMIADINTFDRAETRAINASKQRGKLPGGRAHPFHYWLRELSHRRDQKGFRSILE